jgi:asparaginyl-tRNA synthetase
LNLKCDLLVSKFAFKSNLYRYTEAAAAEQGAAVKALKDAKKAGDDVTKEDVNAAVAKLLALKAAAEELENPTAAAPAAAAAAGASHGDVPRNKDGSVDYTKDFFGKPSYMTVSGQLNAEVGLYKLNPVYP